MLFARRAEPASRVPVTARTRFDLPNRARAPPRSQRLTPLVRVPRLPPMVEAGGEPDGERRRVNSSISQACRAVKRERALGRRRGVYRVQRHHSILKTGATFIAFTVSCSEAVVAWVGRQRETRRGRYESRAATAEAGRSVPRGSRTISVTARLRLSPRPACAFEISGAGRWSSSRTLVSCEALIPRNSVRSHTSNRCLAAAPWRPGDSRLQ